MARKVKDIIVMFNHIRYVAKDGVIYRQDIPTIWRNCNPAQVERFLVKKFGPKGLRIVDAETLGAPQGEKVEDKKEDKKEDKLNVGDGRKSDR